MYQLEVDVDMLYAVKNVSADVSSVSPSLKLIVLVSGLFSFRNC